MKITQEVRDFAAKQNTDSFLAASLSPPAGESDLPQASGERGRHGEAEAEQGMAKMSEKFRQKGGEIYLPARDSRS
jgi:phosphomethylpyrimidine synthase